MQQKIVQLIILFFPFITIAQNIGWVYQYMPAELSPILNETQRFELIEYAKEGRQETIKNKFQGQACMLAYNEQQNYLKVAQTANSTLALKTIPTSANDYLIIAIYTVSAPISSSTITIYNKSWQVQKTYQPSFKASDFLIMQHNLNEDELKDITPIFVSAEFSTTAETIEFTNQTYQILPEKQQKRYLPYLQTYMIPLQQILP
mgnify:CR=1 FL=1